MVQMESIAAYLYAEESPDNKEHRTFRNGSHLLEMEQVPQKITTSFKGKR